MAAGPCFGAILRDAAKRPLLRMRLRDGIPRDMIISRTTLMPVPTHIFERPSTIVRPSHAVLDVTDLKASREFYENSIGLHGEDADSDTVYLRGSEEHQHHSLVLRKAEAAACARLGFKVGNEGDLDKAAAFFAENGILYAFVKRPFQGRTLHFT